MNVKTSFIIALTCSTLLLQAQDQADVSVDQLAAPSSPGIFILGGEVTSIEKPTNTTDLALSLLTAGDNSSLLPNNYAIDLNPYWLFGGGKTTFDELISNSDIPKNIVQSFQVSFATKMTTGETSASDSTLLGVGFKFSILRGQVSPKFITFINNEVRPKLAELNQTLESKITAKKENDPSWNLLRQQIQSPGITDETQRQQLIALFEVREKEIVEEVLSETKELAEELETLGSDVKFVRYGFKLDLAGALAVSFPMQSYSDREVSRFGVWLTGGYETCPKQDQKGSWSFLGVIRYLRNYNESYTDVNDLILAADNSYVDIGARIIYTHQEKISVSAELLNRKNTSEAEMQVDETTRYTFNLNYQLPDNKLITFTYGKDFSGAVNKSGNLIAALGLIVGIGSKRPMQ